MQRRYRDGDNVLETTGRTDSGCARLAESLNSGQAGRLPWSQLARRLEGLDGSVEFDVQFRPGTPLARPRPG